MIQLLFVYLVVELVHFFAYVSPPPVSFCCKPASIVPPTHSISIWISNEVRMPRSGSFSEYWLGVLHWSQHSENTTVPILSTIHMENAPPGPSIVGLSGLSSQIKVPRIFQQNHFMCCLTTDSRYFCSKRISKNYD